MFPFKMRRRGEGGRRWRRRRDGGVQAAGCGRQPASPPPPPSPRGASRAAPAAAPLRVASYDLPAALTPSALSAWPGTCAQIAAAANLPAPPSPLSSSLPPPLPGRPAPLLLSPPPPVLPGQLAPAAATRPPVPARPSSPRSPEPALLARATEWSPGARVQCPSHGQSVPCAAGSPHHKPRCSSLPFPQEESPS